MKKDEGEIDTGDFVEVGLTPDSDINRKALPDDMLAFMDEVREKAGGKLVAIRVKRGGKMAKAIMDAHKEYVQKKKSGDYD